MFLSRFFSGNRSWQFGYHSNIFNNLGQHFDRNFGKAIESQVSWRKYKKKGINKKLNRLPISDGVNETRENDDERKCCKGKMFFCQSNELIVASGFPFVGKMMVKLKVRAYFFATEYQFWGFFPSFFHFFNHRFLLLCPLILKRCEK